MKMAAVWKHANASFSNNTFVLSSRVAIYDGMFRSPIVNCIDEEAGANHCKQCAVNSFIVQQGFYWYCTLMLCIVV